MSLSNLAANAVRMSEKVNELFTALADAQATAPTVAKNATDSFYGSKYATLEAVLEAAKPVLDKYSLSVTVFPGDPATIVVGHSTGQFLIVEAQLGGRDEGSKRARIQDMGANLTYLRRYALCTVLGIVADEDLDGNTPEQQTGKTTPARSRSDASGKGKQTRRRDPDDGSKKGSQPAAGSGEKKGDREVTGYVIGTDVKKSQPVEKGGPSKAWELYIIKIEEKSGIVEAATFEPEHLDAADRAQNEGAMVTVQLEHNGTWTDRSNQAHDKWNILSIEALADEVPTGSIEGDNPNDIPF